jgi:hypothetical protein
MLMKTPPRRNGDSLRRLTDSKNETNVGPVDISKEKITPRVTMVSPIAPTPSQRFRESPGIKRNRIYC